jgi:predicted aspartyl protease
MFETWGRSLIQAAKSLCVSGLAALLLYSPAFAQTAPVEVPFHLRSGHVVIDLSLNGEGPFHFIFDTGALNVLSPAAARRLNLAVKNNVEAKGTGGTQGGGSTKVDAVRLGALTLSNQTFYVLDLPVGAAEDGRIDGLIGFEWLSRFPTRFDYEASKLTLYPGKDGAGYAGPARAIPLRFRGRTPQIDGAIDGLPGRFTLDTGSNGSLTLSAPFSEKHALATRYHARTRVMSAVGVGGPVYALMARADRLEMGDVTADRPVTYLSQQTTGTSAQKDTAGNIGYGVLRRFNILFDYPASRVYFEPNSHWGEPDLADRSGLRLESADGAFAVMFVAENSPGMAAGIRVGDRIRAVDGVASSALTLAGVRDQLKGPLGARISMTLDRDPGVVVVELGEL